MFIAFIKNRKWLAAGCAGLLIIGGGIAYGISRGQDYELARVERGTVAEQVSIAGKVVAAEDLSLSFETTGKVRRVEAKAGDVVRAGATLVVLDQSSLAAERARVAANLSAEEARLAELRRGSRPEEVRIKETALRQAEQNLAASYATVTETANTAWSDADDAIRRELDALFTNDELYDAKISFETSDYAAKTDAESLRVVASKELSAWRTELDGLYSGTVSEASLEAMLQTGKQRLVTLNTLVNRTGDALRAASQQVPAATIATYKTNVSSARTEVNGALADLTALLTAISSGKLAVERAKDDLALSNAGSAPEVIRSQEARVQEAAASLLDVDTRLSKMVLRAPIAGTVTEQEARVGEVVAPNAPIVSMISEAEFEIEANVPEVTIGRVKKGDAVAVTLDAFPGEEFPGSITYIDPAETLIDGVVNFKAKVALDKEDERIKSGMTANLAVTTLLKKDVLFLPTSAIQEDADGAFVTRLVDGKKTRVPITIGIRGGGGTTEVRSGLSEGDEVLSGGVQ